ncbi:hypothetical protein Tco_1353511 [Tanacetum coccineum]
MKENPNELGGFLQKAGPKLFGPPKSHMTAVQGLVQPDLSFGGDLRLDFFCVQHLTGDEVSRTSFADVSSEVMQEGPVDAYSVTAIHMKKLD